MNSTNVYQQRNHEVVEYCLNAIPVSYSVIVNKVYELTSLTTQKELTKLFKLAQ